MAGSEARQGGPMSTEPDLRPEVETGQWDIAILRHEAEKLCQKHLRAARFGTMLDLPLVLLSTYGQAILSAFALAEVILFRHDPLMAGMAAFVAAVLGIVASLGRHQDRYRRRVHVTSLFA